MDSRLFYPATQRNKKFIGDVLSKLSLQKGFILEIGSGSGEHGIEFQKRFPEIIWQTSDPKLEHRKSISSWIAHEELNLKMPQPLNIDVTKHPWEIPFETKESLLGIISINMIHITPWICTKSLFRESSQLVSDNKKFLILYGPFKIKSQHTSHSNKLFDKSLKLENKNWGVRDLEEVCEEARINGFTKFKIYKMPSNNLSIIFNKVY
tara:strand:- start:122 stop:745 length:624 start_codon:yes stop_codon:yes gene_type:complete